MRAAGTRYARFRRMELHKIGAWIGNGLGWGALAIALAVGLAIILTSVASLVRHRHA